METNPAEPSPATETQAEPERTLLDYLAERAEQALPPPPNPLDVLRGAYAQLDQVTAYVAAIRATLDSYVAAAADAGKFHFPVPTQAKTGGRPSVWRGMLRREGGGGEREWNSLPELGKLINSIRPVAVTTLSSRLTHAAPDSKGQCRFNYPGTNWEGAPCRYTIVGTRSLEGLDHETVRWENYD